METQNFTFDGVKVTRSSKVPQEKKFSPYQWIVRALCRITLFLLLRCGKYPIISLANKLNGVGFVIVPRDQWEGLNEWHIKKAEGE